MDHIVPWLSPVVAVLALVYTILANRGKAAEAKVAAQDARTATAFQQLEGRLASAERKLAEIEGDLEHVPGKDVAHRLELVIGRLEGRLEVMDAKLQPVAAISERLQEFLLDQARVR